MDLEGRTKLEGHQAMHFEIVMTLKYIDTMHFQICYHFKVH